MAASYRVTCVSAFVLSEKTVVLEMWTKGLSGRTKPIVSTTSSNGHYLISDSGQAVSKLWRRNTPCQAMAVYSERQ